MAVTTELVLIRHGETDWNREHRLQGQAKPGPPLNDMGFQQTHMLCHVLQKRYQHFDAVVSSDLQRTLQTAQILAAPYRLQVQQHPGLRERHIGLLQGLTNKEAPAAQPEAWAALQSGDHGTCIPGGGESLNELKQRLAQTLLEIAAQHQGKRVLVISHGGALHATHRAARGYEAHGKVSNCSISVVLAELDAAQLDSCQDFCNNPQARSDSCQDSQHQPDSCHGSQAQPDSCQDSQARPESCQDSQAQRDSCQDCCHNPQDQPDSCQGSGYKPGRAGSSSSSSSSSGGGGGSGCGSSSGGSSDDDVIMHSSMPSSAAGSLGSADDLEYTPRAVTAVGGFDGKYYQDELQQLRAGLGLLFSSTASQGSGCCSSSCCGCCYCMGDACEGGCTGDAYHEAYDDDDDVEGAEEVADGQQQGLKHLMHQQLQGSGADAKLGFGYKDNAQDKVAASAAAAAARDCGVRAVSGKLSMLVWNDSAALFDLEAEEGVGMRAAGFGGSAREA